MSVTGKVAVVTGAGSGIGKRSTLALLDAGFNVVLAGRREDALEATVAESGTSADRTLVVPTDVADAASVENLFAITKEKFGRVDVLFNNAGTSTPNTSIEELTVEQWQTVINVNLTGPFLCTRQAFKLMKEQEPMGGRIINNGSISATAPRPGSAPYTATKHAISGLTKSTALDGRQYNIACGQIDIGNAETEMAARMAEGVPQANGKVAVEPLMDVQHVADAVVQMSALPLESNILFMTIMATKMPFVGRG